MFYGVSAGWSAAMTSLRGRLQSCGPAWSSRSAAKVLLKSRFARWSEPKQTPTAETPNCRETWNCFSRCMEISGEVKKTKKGELEGVSEDLYLTDLDKPGREGAKQCERRRGERRSQRGHRPSPSWGERHRWPTHLRCLDYDVLWPHVREFQEFQLCSLFVSM